MRKLLVIGLGETGEAVLKWAAAQNWSVRVTDNRDNLNQLPQLQQQYPQMEWCTGGSFCDATGSFQLSLLEGITEVVISPGLSPYHAPLKLLYETAVAQGIPVIGEVELFAEAIRKLGDEKGYAPKIVAITGTNGKTTVTALTSHLVERAGISVAKAGNISPSVLTALLEHLAQQTLPDVWVLELSSFQLATTLTLPIEVGVILNITQDHLDWHTDMQNYLEAKCRLKAMSKVMIYNRDDSYLKETITDLSLPAIRTFGMESPYWEGDMGMVFQQGMRWLEIASANDDVPEKKAGRSKKEPLELHRQQGIVKQLMPIQALAIKGTHNFLNVMAAFLVGRSLEISWNSLLRSVVDYKGEPHRVAFVRSVRGVDFYDDSKGTNVGATVAAINGLESKVHLIVGGDGKGQDFTPLQLPVSRFAKGLYVIGKDKALIAETFKSASIPVQMFDSLEAAVQAAYKNATEGEIVLLSPACASWDMFKNYKHRAEVFVAVAEEIALDQGEIV